MSFNGGGTHCLFVSASTSALTSEMNTPNKNIIEQIVRRMETDISTDAPADATRYAKNLYRSRAADPKLSVLKRVIAVLNVNLGLNDAVFGERSAAGQTRQMLFNAGEYAVDLRLKASRNGLNIRGQILGEGFEKGEVTIEGVHGSNKADIDDQSEFLFDSIQSGEYSVSILGRDAEIFVQQLVLE